MDLWIAEALVAEQVPPAAEATLNTETPGSAIDRLAILALRIYHLEEQLHRPDVDAQHLETVGARLSICRLQHDDLVQRGPPTPGRHLSADANATRSIDNSRCIMIRV